MEWLFWILVAVVAYVYAGYPLLIAALARLRPALSPPVPDELPRVTLVFCVHNEVDVLEEKLRNCREIDYPRERLEIIAASDGSTDGSAERLEEAERSGFLRANVQRERTGKTALLNRTVAMATGEIVLCTDASTLLEPDAVRMHVRHYDDARVGCVGGELVFVNAAQGGVSGGHGLYWRYESWIRENESALGMLSFVPGANYSIRRVLWKPVPPNYADDCISPLNVVTARRLVRYDRRAVAREVASESSRGVFSRRVRMVTRDLDATLHHRYLLNPFRYGRISVSLFSHKFLRWVLPVALVALLPVNAALASRPLYAALLAGQVAFYALALVAAARGSRPRSPLLSVPLYFCVSNLGALRGLANVAMGRRIGVWQPVGTR